MKFRACALLLTVAALASAQTKVDLRGQSKNVDFSGATTTKPFKAGTVLPAVCTVGEAYFKVDAAPGANWYGCTATNVWSVQSGGAPGGGGGGASGVVKAADLADLTVTLVNGSTLAVAAGTWGSGNTSYTYAGGTIQTRFPTVSGATNATPIVLTVSSTVGMRNGDTVVVSGVQGNTAANGTFVVSLLSATQLVLNGSTGNGNYTGGGSLAGNGNGAAYIYASDSGNVVVEHPSSAAAILGCTGACVVNQLPSPAFAASSVPMAVVTISGGQFTAIADARRFLSSRGVAAGQGIAVADAGGTARISVDATVARTPMNNVWTGSNSFTAATRTAPFRTGNGTPAAQGCTAGDTYWQLDATPGENLWTCLPNGWQMQAAGSAARMPVIEEEFLSSTPSTTDFGQYRWRSVGDNAPAPDALTGSLGYNHPGVYALFSNGTANSTSAMTLAAANGAQQFVNLGAAAGWLMEAIAVTDSAFATTQAAFRFGLSDGPSSQAAANAIQVRYNSNTGCTTTGTDAGLVFENRSAGAPAVNASSVAVAASQSIHVRIRSVTAGTALFSVSINGGAFTPEVAVTGVPTAAVSPFFSVTSCNATAKKIYVDYFRFVPGTLAR